MKKLDNYRSALNVLVEAPMQDLSNEFVTEGIVNKFNLQFELGWKLLKALLAYEGAREAASSSPRDIIKAAYRYFDFIDEGLWLDMLRDRNDTTHIYDESRLHKLVDNVITSYIPEFQRVLAAVDTRYGEDLSNIA